MACAQPPEPGEPPTCLDFDAVVSDVPDLPVSYETEHLDVHVDPNRFLCAGSAIDYERHVQHVAGQLGLEIQRRIPVYALTGASEYCTNASACTTRDGVVFATTRSAYHELAHGVACEIGTDAPALLAEGLAVSFEPSANTSAGIPEEFSEVPTSEFSPYYSLAGHFTRWLADHLSADAFAALYRTASYDEGVWRMLEAAYGTSLAMDYSTQSPSMWIQHRQCADMPLLEADADGAWVFEARFDCDDEATLGPYEKTNQNEANGSTDMFQSFLIDLPEPGTYRMERSDSISIRYERCLDEHPATQQEIDGEWVRQPVFFTLVDDYALVDFEHPGLWRVDVLHEYGPPVDVWFTITPEP